MGLMYVRELWIYCLLGWYMYLFFFYWNVFFDIVEDCIFVVVYVRINKINNVICEIIGDIFIK